jgi:hypothetical protein
VHQAAKTRDEEAGSMGNDMIPTRSTVNVSKISKELDKVSAHLTKLNDTVARLKGHVAAPAAAPPKKRKG